MHPDREAADRILATDRALAAGRSRRHRTHEPAPATLPAPDIRREGDAFLFSWPAHGIAVGIDQLREMGDGLHGEISVQSSVGGPLYWGRLNLASVTGRENLQKSLSSLQPEVDWRRLLNGVCQRVAEEWRRGDPVKILLPVAATGAQYLVEKLLPLNATSVLFGDGGQGKSWLALALAVSVATGKPLPCGLRPNRTCPVLVLDWETNEEDAADRLRALLNGLDITDYAGQIHYRRMSRSLTEDAHFLRSEIARLEVGFVVVDSLGAACGAEPEGADAAVRTMNALRSFPATTSQVIAHVSKAMADQRGPSRPYGSVYVQNLARSVWEVRRSEDEDTLTIGLYHRKTNRGKLMAPFGLTFAFEGPEDLPSAVRIRAQDIATSTDLLGKASLSTRLQALLRSGAMSTSEIVEAVEAPESSVARTLRRLKARGKIISLDEVRGGKGHESRWGLAQL